MDVIIHKSDTRGRDKNGWLDSHHTFSFGNYLDHERVHFGMLRVLNDDTVAPGMGFGTHPHNNMEIISIPLNGTIQHEDSTGSLHTLTAGDIQVMSAGSGITHSEYNASTEEALEFLQIWIFSDRRDANPRYDQARFDEELFRNSIYPVVGPHGLTEGLWIYQDAWVYLSQMDADTEITHYLKDASHGAYVFVIEGSATVSGTELGRRDGAGFSNTSSLEIKSGQDSKILIIEVPMN